MTPNNYIMGLDVYSPKPTEGVVSMCVINRDDNTIAYISSFRVEGCNISKIAEEEAKKVSEHFGNCYIMKEGE